MYMIWVIRYVNIVIKIDLVSISYQDKKTKIKSKICRYCYNKATGCKTRKEKQMVDYIKKSKFGNYIISSNQKNKRNELYFQ